MGLPVVLVGLEVRSIQVVQGVLEVLLDSACNLRHFLRCQQRRFRFDLCYQVDREVLAGQEYQVVRVVQVVQVGKQRHDLRKHSRLLLS